MSEYIEQEALKENIYNKVNNSLIRGWLERIINDTPSADVAEVKHGKWTSNGLMNPQCSLCRKYNIEKSRFCPNCRAKMDGEGE